MRKIAALIIIFCFLLTVTPISAIAESEFFDTQTSFYANADIELGENIGAAYLCESSTGKVIYAKNEFQAAPPASVTKIMTLLLVMEALEEGKFKLDDTVRVSAKAASMGGSQVFLEEGEKITVEELIKSTVIASGNDSSVALAELTAGSEASFVKMMNSKANELGLKNTSFENTTGLDDTTSNHYSCAADIAKMSRELIKHELILKYSSIWQDTIRNGEFTLTNTNRLVRYYEGCNGLKTGSTDKAGYCISATAKRGNMQLIAVIMGAETRDARNNAARELLDYGFANYALYERGEEFIEKIPVYGGTNDFVSIYSKPFSCVVEKSALAKINLEYEIPECLFAPVLENEKVGEIIYKIDNEQVGASEIISLNSSDKITLGNIYLRVIKRMLCG